MPDIQQHISLKQANTLALSVSARYYLRIEHQQQIPEAIAFAQSKALPVLVLGGGSNVILNGDFAGLVIHMCLTGLQFAAGQGDDDEVVRVTAAAGENWNDLVQTCLAKGYYGLENLSLIPGSVGAAPIQNIGAYGVEFAERFESLTGWDCRQQCWRTLDIDECEFGYRDSVFKQRLKDQFIITSVTMRLSCKPNVNISYGVLNDTLEKQHPDLCRNRITPRQVADAVIAIRRSKLPDPEQLPNVGSFFKNPVIDRQTFENLQRQYPMLVHYPQPDGRIKLAAGWLLDHAGWRGKTFGAVGMHSAQALVMINCGEATAADVMALAERIQQDILQRFGVHLEIEPALY